MDLRQQKIAQFNWNWKKCNRSSEMDLTINFKKDGSLSFIFRNEIEQMISSTGYFVMAVCKNRMLFMEAQKDDGYCISHNKGSANKYAQLQCKEANSFAGSYELKYDNFLELYYIEKEVDTNENS